MHEYFPTRRQMIHAGIAVAALPILGGAAVSAAEPTPQKADPCRGLKIGVASYTFRQRPLEPTIAGIRRVGLSYVSIKDFHLPLKSTAEERKMVAKKFADAGITTLSCGVVATPNKEDFIRHAFEYARDTST